MSAPAVVLLDLTDFEGIAHLVTLDAMAAGRRSGRYRARCNRTVLAASLTTPGTARCRACRGAER